MAGFFCISILSLNQEMQHMNNVSVFECAFPLSNDGIHQGAGEVRKHDKFIVLDNFLEIVSKQNQIILLRPNSSSILPGSRPRTRLELELLFVT
jgi:hypothetical protein